MKITNKNVNKKKTSTTHRSLRIEIGKRAIQHKFRKMLHNYVKKQQDKNNWTTSELYHLLKNMDASANFQVKKLK